MPIVLRWRHTHPGRGAVLLALIIPSGVGASLLPDRSTDYGAHSSQLRSDLLGADNYDALVPPTSNRSSPSSSAGAEVELDVRFFKVESVSMAEGSMRMKVWYRLLWQDLRLAWDPAAYGGITYTHFLAQTAVGVPAFEAEIWVPDVQPYNAMQSIVNTLDPTLARVYYDGTVYFSRPGTLDVMCRFSGLVAFPFDQLKCSVEVGGWMLSGDQQGLQLRGGVGYSLGDEITTASSYQEYTIEEVSSTSIAYEYVVGWDAPDATPETYPVMLYTVTLSRSSHYYTLVVVLPGFLITMLSFAVFFTDTGSADPLGYGIGTIVVVLLNNVVLLGMLPLCNELLWLDLYMAVNTCFCCFSLFESALMVMIENHEGDDLLPYWMVLVWRWTYNKLNGVKASMAKYKVHNKVARELDPSLQALATLSEGDVFDESYAAVLVRQMGGTIPDQPPEKKKTTKYVRTSEMAERRSLSEDEVARLMYFERLFFDVDIDKSLSIEEDECALFLAFALMDTDAEQRSQIFAAYDFVENGKLNRMEFLTLCRDVLWQVPLSRLEAAAHNMFQARMSRANANKMRWQGLATKLEQGCRIFVPAAYILSMIIIFNLDMTDDYAVGLEMTSTTKTTKPADANTVSTTLNSKGCVLLIFYFGTAICCVLAWATARSIGRKAQARFFEDKKKSIHASVSEIESARPSAGVWQPSSSRGGRGATPAKTRVDDAEPEATVVSCLYSVSEAPTEVQNF